MGARSGQQFQTTKLIVALGYDLVNELKLVFASGERSGRNFKISKLYFALWVRSGQYFKNSKLYFAFGIRSGQKFKNSKLDIAFEVRPQEGPGEPRRAQENAG